MSLGLTVLLPLFVGQVIQFIFPKPVAKVKDAINFGRINNIVLMLIVYTTFCDSFADESQEWDAQNLSLVIGIATGLHLVYLAAVYGLSCIKWFRFTRGDKVAILFCSTHKTSTIFYTTN
jgi:sodium/bile acid cotransporter 7